MKNSKNGVICSYIGHKKYKGLVLNKGVTVEKAFELCFMYFSTFYAETEKYDFLCIYHIP